MSKTCTFVELRNLMLVHVSMGTRLIWPAINAELHVYKFLGALSNHILQVLEFNNNISILLKMMVIIINTPL